MPLFPSRWSAAGVLPAVLVTAVAGVILAFVLVGFLRTTVPAAPPLATPDDRVALLEQRIAELEADAGDIRQLLTLLLLVGGFYTALQGVFNYYSVQNFTKQAESELGRIKEMVSDVQGRFPMFAVIEKRRREAFDDLAATLPNDWRDEGYTALEIETRQRIFSLEAFVGLEFSGTPDRRVAQNLYNLGRFYGSKYVSTPADRRDAFDLDRAEYYLQLALSGAKRPYHILNELGLIYVEFRRRRDETDEERLRRLKIAEGYFERSRKINGRQQRALYNLALVAFHRRDYAAAQPFLEQAVDALTVWEDAPDLDMLCHARYNLACVYCRRAEALHAQHPQDGRVGSLVSAACVQLEKAAEIGAVEERAFIRDDLKSEPDTGDLGFLSLRPEAAARVAGALATFERRWQERGLGTTVQG